MMSEINASTTFNLSTSTDEPRTGLTRMGHNIVAVFLGLILFFGFVNNLVVFILFCKFKTLRNPVNMLLLNISASDMLVCISGTTFSFISNIYGRWIGGEHGCRWYGFVNSCFGIVSLISLAILSYERYSTLTLANKRGSSYQKALLGVGGSWLYSLIWTVPPLIGWSSYGLEGAGTSCSVRWTSETPESVSYIICLFIFCLALPVLVMIYCYARLFYAVKQVGKIRKTAARKREFHVLFMVITTIICYLICWMPYGVIALLATFGRPGLVSPLASIIPSILAKSSTVYNPIIYILMNKQVCMESLWMTKWFGLQLLTILPILVSDTVLWKLLFKTLEDQRFMAQLDERFTSHDPLILELTAPAWYNFYKCFLILLRCQPPSAADGESTKVKAIQLNQRAEGGVTCHSQVLPQVDEKAICLLSPESSTEHVSDNTPQLSKENSFL